MDKISVARTQTTSSYGGRNGAKSTGPKTPEGKSLSKWNALKHGLLAREVVISASRYPRTDASGTHGRLLLASASDTAARAEVGEIRRGLKYEGWDEEDELDTEDDPEISEIPPHLSLPDADAMDKILRYENLINRQLQQAIDQLERLKRQRKGGMSLVL